MYQPPALSKMTKIWLSPTKCWALDAAANGFDAHQCTIGPPPPSQAVLFALFVRRLKHPLFVSFNPNCAFSNGCWSLKHAMYKVLYSVPGLGLENLRAPLTMWFAVLIRL